jgi:hypothetical protein
VFAPAEGMDPLALRDVVTVMVLSPWFLYRVENEGEALAGTEGVFRLSAYEMAARLALHFWDAPPDDQLLSAAESGALDSEEGYEAEVDRLLADPRTQRTMDRFFSEWLELDDLAPLEQGLSDPAYAVFVGDDVPTPELRANMIEDSLDLLRFTTWRDEGSLADVFLTDRSFAKTDDMRALYGGVAAWDGESTPARLESGGRAGILTRPAMLATGSPATHPTLRGRDIRKRVLCGEMPPKPDDVDLGNLPVIDPVLGERARMEQLTGDGTCAGCHSLMDPLGFNLGHFDGLGRYREVETVYADDGSVIAEVTLDTTSSPNIADGEQVSSAVELSEAVVESGEPQACFARHYFRFAFARAEDFEADGCLLEDMRTRLDDGEPLRAVLRDIALSTAFRTKKLAD